MKYIAACEAQAWSLTVWPKDNQDAQTTVPYRCRSWRHKGECRIWKGKQDLARIGEALEYHLQWLFLTMTYDRQTHRLDTVWKRAVKHWSKLRKRIVREWGSMRYIQTWERHADGWPHVHIAMVVPVLWHLCSTDPVHNFHKWVRDDAVACGFGRIGYLERVRSEERMAQYLKNKGSELTGGGKKEYQIPINAPPHFRRIRASAKTLPPVRRNPDITGQLNRFSVDGEVIDLAPVAVVEMQSARQDGGPKEEPPALQGATEP